MDFFLMNFMHNLFVKRSNQGIQSTDSIIFCMTSFIAGNDTFYCWLEFVDIMKLKFRQWSNNNCSKTSESLAFRWSSFKKFFSKLKNFDKKWTSFMNDTNFYQSAFKYTNSIYKNHLLPIKRNPPWKKY